VNFHITQFPQASLTFLPLGFKYFSRQSVPNHNHNHNFSLGVIGNVTSCQMSFLMLFMHLKCKTAPVKRVFFLRNWVRKQHFRVIGMVLSF